MNRQHLIEQLTDYVAFNEQENSMQKRMLSFVKKHKDCFNRELLIGHLTASCWVLDEKKEQVLLLHHVKLNKWLQPGGHCDGNEDIYAVAKQELVEETGLRPLFDLKEIFDVDIHTIPERKGIPEHEHFDIRFLFMVNINDELIQNHETNALKRVFLKEIEDYTKEESVLRMRDKL